MPKSLNKVMLIGYVGGDPEVRYINSGDAVANLSLATSESWTKDGEKHERTEWHRLVVWRKLAEIVGEYVKKGSRLYVEGRIQTRKWEKDGQTHYATEIVVESLIMLGGGKGESTSEGREEPPAGAPLPPKPADDDLPF